MQYAVHMYSVRVETFAVKILLVDAMTDEN